MAATPKDTYSSVINTLLWRIQRFFLEGLLGLPRRLNISYLLFFSHLLLVIWLVVIMSFNRFRSEWQANVHHAVEVARLSLNPIVEDLSLAASGLSYANIHLPATRNLFRNAGKLLYFEVEAISDYSKQPFHFAYSRDKDDVWRTGLETDEEKEALATVNRLENALHNEPGIDQVKYGFLLNRARERHDAIMSDMEKARHYSTLYHKAALIPGEYVIDEELKTLQTLVMLNNSGGGKLWAVFNAEELLILKERMKTTILKEALLALLVSSILIIWATWWIVRPLRRLAAYMTHDIHELDVSVLPELNRDDEIGQLARCYRNLVTRIRNQITDLERLAIIDALTGLGSRRLYDTSGRTFLKQVKRTGHYFGMLVIDVDHFKLYNDTYGHAQGDEGLKMIGRVLKATLQRETDLAFRIGGEEFIVMIQVTSADEVAHMAEQIRKAVLKEKMIHEKNGPGVISVSIGGVTLSTDHQGAGPTLNQLFKVADKALYTAKASGRNRVSITRIDTPEPLPLLLKTDEPPRPPEGAMSPPP